jgi:hypothetical protein
LSANAKNTVDAEKYYKRVIEINPHTNAYINLAAMKLENEKVIDEMNKLGTSTNDMKRYDELKRKEKIFSKLHLP